MPAGRILRASRTRVERDAPLGSETSRESGPGWKPGGRHRVGTTRERPANRPGIRPLARHERAALGWTNRPGVVKAGGTAGAEPLVLSTDEGFLIPGGGR